MQAKTVDQKIEKLARAVNKGFEDVTREFAEFRAEFRQEVKELRKEMATKADKAELKLTEERLLDAIRNTEVKKRDFDALADRVEVLEKAR